MRKSDNKDLIKEWVETTGREKAPAGFSQKVMSQIGVSVQHEYKNPISKRFLVAAVTVFVSLLVIAIIIPSESNHAFINGLNESIRGLFPDIQYSVSVQGLTIISRYLLYFSLGVLLFLFTDRLFSRLLRPKKSTDDN